MSLVRIVSNGVSLRIRPVDMPWTAKTTRSKFTQTNKSIKRRVRAIKLSLNSGYPSKSCWKSSTKESLLTSKTKRTYRFCIIHSAVEAVILTYRNFGYILFRNNIYINVNHFIRLYKQMQWKLHKKKYSVLGWRSSFLFWVVEYESNIKIGPSKIFNLEWKSGSKMEKNIFPL